MAIHNEKSVSGSGLSAGTREVLGGGGFQTVRTPAVHHTTWLRQIL